MLHACLTGHAIMCTGGDPGECGGPRYCSALHSRAVGAREHGARAHTQRGGLQGGC